MKKLLLCSLFLSIPLVAQQVPCYPQEGFYDPSDNDNDCEDLSLDCPDCMIEEEWANCSPYDVDVDEVWFWENETMYPTRKEDSWVDDLSRPW